MSDDGTLPTIMTTAGLQPLSPATWRARLVALVAASNPGYTDDLPGTLVEDIASTDVGALSLSDQTRVDLINSVDPNGANDFILLRLGTVYGVTRGQPTNTEVEVTVTAVDANDNPLPGLVISRGFLVSDGTYQYVIDDGGITQSNGVTPSMSATATQTGIWAVPAHTVQQVVTAAPSGISLTVDNPLPGTPGTDLETMDQFRVRVLRAGLASAVGTPRFLRTALSNVPGVVDRLVSVRQRPGGGWIILCGGTADDYAVAGAIFSSMDDIGTDVLSGSTLSVTGITQANPGVVTTDHDHNYATGRIVTITGLVGMGPLNGVPVTITVLTNRSFSVGVNTSGYPAWISGGSCSPVLRNVAVTINDYPDTYVLPFVRPPQQTILTTLTWNTDFPNFVASAAVAQLGVPAIIRYVNTIPAGHPFNALDATGAFKAAVASVLPGEFLTRVLWTVVINGVEVTPDSGTYAYEGDPESYFYADSSSAVVVQG